MEDEKMGRPKTSVLKRISASITPEAYDKYKALEGSKSQIINQFLINGKMESSECQQKLTKLIQLIEQGKLRVYPTFKELNIKDQEFLGGL